MVRDTGRTVKQSHGSCGAPPNKSGRGSLRARFRQFRLYSLSISRPFFAA